MVDNEREEYTTREIFFKLLTYGRTRRSYLYLSLSSSTFHLACSMILCNVRHLPLARVDVGGLAWARMAWWDLAQSGIQGFFRFTSLASRPPFFLLCCVLSWTTTPLFPNPISGCAFSSPLTTLSFLRRYDTSFLSLVAKIKNDDRIERLPPTLDECQSKIFFSNVFVWLLASSRAFRMHLRCRKRRDRGKMLSQGDLFLNV